MDNNKKISEFLVKSINFNNNVYVPFIETGNDKNLRTSGAEFLKKIAQAPEFQEALAESGLGSNPIFSLVNGFEFSLSEPEYLIKLSYSVSPTDAEKFYNPLFEIGNTVASLATFIAANNDTIKNETSATNRPYKDAFYTEANSLILNDDVYYLANEPIRYWLFSNSIPPLTTLGFNAISGTADALGAIILNFNQVETHFRNAFVKAGANFTPPTSLNWKKTQGNKRLKTGTISAVAPLTSPATPVDFVLGDKPESFIDYIYTPIAPAIPNPENLSLGESLEWLSSVQDTKGQVSNATAKIEAVVPIYLLEASSDVLTTAIAESGNAIQRVLTNAKVVLDRNFLGGVKYSYLIVKSTYAEYITFSINNQTPDLITSGNHLITTVAGLTIDGITDTFKVYRSIAQQGTSYNIKYQ